MYLPVVLRLHITDRLSYPLSNVPGSLTAAFVGRHVLVNS